MVAPVPAQIPSLRPRPPVAPLRRRSLPLLATHYPLSTLFFVSPLISYSYELLFPQPLYLDNDPHCPPGVGVQASNPPPNSVPRCRCLPAWQIHCFQAFAASLPSLCALFCTPSLCCQSFAASFPKTPGGGVPAFQPPASDLQRPSLGRTGAA